MADTRVQLEVEDWVRDTWMPEKFGARFRRHRMRLKPGGVFDFDAVSDDNTTVCTISTSRSQTSTGKHAVGKLMKLRADMLFLTMTACARRVMIVTDRGMHELLEKERLSGRTPIEIEFLHAELPTSLAERLRIAQKAASDEVTPRT